MGVAVHGACEVNRYEAGRPTLAGQRERLPGLRELLRGLEPLSDSEDDEDFFDDYSWPDPQPRSGGRCAGGGENSPVGIRTGPSELYADAPVLVCTYEVVLIQLNRSLTFFDRMPLLIIDDLRREFHHSASLPLLAISLATIRRRDRK